MWPLTTPELHSKTEKKKRDHFIKLIERKHGTTINPPKQSKKKKMDLDFEFEPCLCEDEEPRKIPDYDEPVDANPEHDRIANAEAQLQLGNELSKGVVKRWAVGPEGKVVGSYDDNPILNSMVYEVEFPDGQVKECAANIITENVLTQVDSEGCSSIMMEGIID